MRPVHDSVPITELAMEYANIIRYESKSDFGLLQRMQGRIGAEHTERLINEALATLMLLDPHEDSTFKWYAGMSIRR